MIYLPEQDRIAVSSSQSQVVLLLDPVNLGTVETIPVGSAPQGLLVHDDLLYIAESASNTVTVYELRTRRVVRRLNVGFSPRRLWAAGNNVYVANHGSGSLSVFLPGQLAVSSEIKTGGRPLDMNSSENRKWLYVSDAVSGGLIVVDTTSNRVAGRIALGAVPQGLAVIQ
jgi:YVTN family beta-propeller protein